jgi:hypothetical protein
MELGLKLVPSAHHPFTRDQSQQDNDLVSVPIDGRPRFAKRSLDDGEKVKIAAIDPDFA